MITPVSFVQMMRDTNRIAMVAAKLRDGRATKEVALRLQTAFTDNDLAGLRVKTWMEIAEDYHFVRLFLVCYNILNNQFQGVEGCGKITH